MEIVRTVTEVRARVAAWRRAGKTVALVPTMGNLHAGHMSLVRAARHEAEVTVVSIFVNPTQFAPSEDFDAYPRTLEADAALLRAHGADLLFAPSVDEMYPLGANTTWVEVAELGRYLCGAQRPSHFRGVTTVVSKLFLIVAPDVAVFGEKDYQQLTILRRMTAELQFPIRIVGVPTWREADGLAFSSRNGYLTEAERKRAPVIQKQLQLLKSAIEHGRRDYRALEREMSGALTAQGFKVDYVSVAGAETLAPAGPADRKLVIAAAAYLGKPRLIDNVRLDLPAEPG